MALSRMLFCWMFVFALAADLTVVASARVTDGLVVLYDFAEPKGTTIHDRSGIEPALDLQIDAAGSVDWGSGHLSFSSAAAIRSAAPADKIIQALKRSGQLSVEVWLKPQNRSQSGPARIVSLSGNSSQRNFTLGQEKDVYDVRLRTTARDRNGLPSSATAKNSVSTKLTHVVFTRDQKGNAAFFIDGAEVASSKVDGNFDNWDNSFRLMIGNEATNDRPWLGELHLVAIFARALSVAEVQQNFTAGSSNLSPDPPNPLAESATLFNHSIAPLLAKHCLECHDSAIKKGDLDLSRSVTALAGGESGVVLTPGSSAESLLWQSVSSGEMPKDRSPLTAEEQQTFQRWIDSGAVYALEQIDPVIYQHGGGSGEVWVQRLTVNEYITTVRSAVGVDIATEADEMLPPDLRADGFRNTSYNLSVDLKHVEAYARLAEKIVERMDVAAFAARFSKNKNLSTDDKMRDHVAAMGKWLLRGPLDEREINVYSGIATTVASAGGDFQQAMAFIIEAMLQSPRFIYRVESQFELGVTRQVGPYELASRLSYILWGAPPDEELFQAAERGELSKPKVLTSQVARMLKDPRAIEQSTEFVSQWLNLPRLENMSPDKQRFPDWNQQLADDMQQETRMFFRDVIWDQNRPMSDLLNAQFTYATPALAKHYGFPVSGKGMQRYDLTANSNRGGLLTQGSVLTIGGDGASMVSRGLFVLHDLLRGTINAPPPCVNTTPPPAKLGLTQRGIAEQRIADAKCGVCHVRFEPLAFGLEKYDSLGRFQDADLFGNKLRDDGEVLFPGHAKPIAYQSSAELMNLLSDSERVQQSLTWKVTQFALGRPLTAFDAPIVAEIHREAQLGGGTYPSLMSAILASDLVLKSGIRLK